MATPKSNLKAKKPLEVKLLNASGKVIEGIIPSGKWPDVRELRYPVETLLELIASGMTHQEILADYEDLDQQDLPVTY